MKKTLLILFFVGILSLTTGCGNDSDSTDPVSPLSGSIATNLSTIVMGQNVTLTWNGNVGDEWVGFNVYDLTISYGDNPMPMTSIAETSLTVTDLEYGKTYIYQVSTIHEDGHESEPTNRVEVLIEEDIDPVDN
ncbi:MAG: hypothetical protein B6244_09760 [Candidatus Cloacimonetes bacterium 4572_55]|nr:MAG: hypothetical protein B6244_09760 [Candidatus Cloacimonetes bacterium 4572_55]